METKLVTKVKRSEIAKFELEEQVDLGRLNEVDYMSFVKDKPSTTFRV